MTDINPPSFSNTSERTTVLEVLAVDQKVKDIEDFKASKGGQEVSSWGYQPKSKRISKKIFRLFCLQKGAERKEKTSYVKRGSIKEQGELIFQDKLYDLKTIILEEHGIDITSTVSRLQGKDHVGKAKNTLGAESNTSRIPRAVSGESLSIEQTTIPRSSESSADAPSSGPSEEELKAAKEMDRLKKQNFKLSKENAKLCQSLELLETLIDEPEGAQEMDLMQKENAELRERLELLSTIIHRPKEPEVARLEKENIDLRKMLLDFRERFDRLHLVPGGSSAVLSMDDLSSIHKTSQQEAGESFKKSGGDNTVLVIDNIPNTNGIPQQAGFAVSNDDQNERSKLDDLRQQKRTIEVDISQRKSTSGGSKAPSVRSLCSGTGWGEIRSFHGVRVRQDDGVESFADFNINSRSLCSSSNGEVIKGFVHVGQDNGVQPVAQHDSNGIECNLIVGEKEVHCGSISMLSGSIM
mmetsp:Transcript_20897/g.30960  ORF Transcript_20897/g.30960 Transcript_20897/m.30960 type:complete len:467 (-) Transcript_20897:12-1412(-)